MDNLWVKIKDKSHKTKVKGDRLSGFLDDGAEDVFEFIGFFNQIIQF
jgi:hypothetical protein